MSSPDTPAPAEKKAKAKKKRKTQHRQRKDTKASLQAPPVVGSTGSVQSLRDDVLEAVCVRGRRG